LRHRILRIFKDQLDDTTTRSQLDGVLTSDTLAIFSMECWEKEEAIQYSNYELICT